MTLTQLLGAAGVATQRNGFQRWLTPVGIYHRKRLRYGQLYCPGCLNSGRNYLPMEWRLGSSWMCDLHALMLRDSCASCDAPFAPYRHDALLTGRCDRCSAALFRSPTQKAPEGERALQLEVRSLWTAAFEGDGQALAAFHESLTNAARMDAEFCRSGEPWTFWRIAHRRDLLVKVAQATLLRPRQPTPKVSITPRRPVRAARRRCRVLPQEPAARARVLLQLASRVRFARRPRARMGKRA